MSDGGIAGYGDFGGLAAEYQQARKPFPNEVMEYIFSKMPDKKGQRVLDVACGTGIASRQMRQFGAQIVGTDISVEMLNQARALNGDIKYHIAPAENQPFVDHSFHAVTVFSAFHWFPYSHVLKEFKRVLKPGGILFIINKKDASKFKSGIRSIVEATINTSLPEAKKRYSPDILLSATGFKSVQTQRFSFVESYTSEEAVIFLQSMSLWNLVPQDKRPCVVEKLRKFVAQNSDNRDSIGRELDIVVVSGKC